MKSLGSALEYEGTELVIVPVMLDGDTVKVKCGSRFGYPDAKTPKTEDGYVVNAIITKEWSDTNKFERLVFSKAMVDKLNGTLVKVCAEVGFAVFECHGRKPDKLKYISRCNSARAKEYAKGIDRSILELMMYGETECFMMFDKTRCPVCGESLSAMGICKNTVCSYSNTLDFEMLDKDIVHIHWRKLLQHFYQVAQGSNADTEFAKKCGLSLWKWKRTKTCYTGEVKLTLLLKIVGKSEGRVTYEYLQEVLCKNNIFYRDSLSVVREEQTALVGRYIK